MHSNLTKFIAIIGVLLFVGACSAPQNENKETPLIVTDTPLKGCTLRSLCLWRHFSVFKRTRYTTFCFCFGASCIMSEENKQEEVSPSAQDELDKLNAQITKQGSAVRQLKKDGAHSTLTDEREFALGCLGFVWDSHAASWEERWNELREYRNIHGHSNVPKKYSENPQLSVWVKCQRRQFKLHSEGKASNMNPDRIRRLLELDFDFLPRKNQRRDLL